VVLRTLSIVLTGGTVMRPFKCLLGRHDWHSEYDHEAQVTNWSCRRCGVTKIKLGDPTVRGIFKALG
jgi:hypothetical protein